MACEWKLGYVGCDPARNSSNFRRTALQQLVGDHATEWGRFAAGAVLVSVPVMVLFFALQRHLVGGLTAGSVKG